MVDVGLKSEGRVALREFANGGTGAPEVREGDTVDIFVDRMENKDGEAVLSRDKAKREESWTRLEKQFSAGEKVTGPTSGPNTYRLIGTSEFDLPAHKGHMVLVKGLFIKASPTSRVNVTSVTMVATTCTAAK